MNADKSALLVIVCLLLNACRQDMHDQPRYKPLAGTGFFGDGRSARPEIAGTVAWGRASVGGPDPAFLHTDAARYTGKTRVKDEDVDIDYFPFPITRADLERGQQRFNIYCSPCHSRIGDGNGLVVLRGYHQAASYHTEKLMNAPVGHFFDVMTNGFGAMPSYGSRVSADDRWRIAAYIRVLQLSQAATFADVPVNDQGALR